jgi:hypothetical protein
VLCIEGSGEVRVEYSGCAAASRTPLETVDVASPIDHCDGCLDIGVEWSWLPKKRFGAQNAHDATTPATLVSTSYVPVPQTGKVHVQSRSFFPQTLTHLSSTVIRC